MKSKNSRFHPIKFSILANNILVSLFFMSLCRDSNGKEIPSIAMATGSVEEFQVNPITRKDCPKKSLTYYVKKLGGEGELNFHVTTDRKFTENQKKPAHPLMTDTYDNQIAYATCTPGWIEMIYVDTDYRGCGVGSTLTALCLLDPEINTPREENKALRRLENIDKDNKVDFLRQNCKRLVGMFFESDRGLSSSPFSGGYMYFSTAVKMTYEKVMIHLYDAEKQRCLPEFLLYDVADIRNKKLFDGKTGLIEDYPGTGKGSVWNFCEVRFITCNFLQK